MTSFGRHYLGIVLVGSLMGSTGCGWMMSRAGGGGSSSSSSSGSAGPITIQNQTEHSICTIEVNQNGAEPGFIVVDLSSSPVEQGGSTTIDTAGSPYKLRLIECGDEYVLWDSNDPANNRDSETITPDGRPFVLADGGSVEGNLLTLERTPVSAYVRGTGSLHSEYGDAVLSTAREFASSHNYRESFTGANVVASDWEFNRNRRTGAMIYRWFMADIGARWPDGHCTIQGMGMIQQHDGSDFVENLTTQGMDAQSQRQVPCAALELLESK